MDGAEPLREIRVIGKPSREGEPFPISRQRGLYFFISTEQFDRLNRINEAYKASSKTGVKPLEEVKIVGRGGYCGYRPFLLGGRPGLYLCILADHLRQLEQINRAYAELLEARELEAERTRKLAEDRERVSKIVESVKTTIADARKGEAPRYAFELMQRADETLAEIEAAYTAEEYDRVLGLASGVDELIRKARSEALEKAEEAKKIEPMEKPSEEGRYVYCVIPWTGEGEFSFGDLGIEGSGKVYAIPCGDIAAVASNSPFKEYVPTEENARTHNQVITRVMEKYPAVPVEYGTAFKNEEILKKVFKRIRKDLKKALKDFGDKVEMDLEAIQPKGVDFDENALISEIRSNLPKIAVNSKLGKKFSKHLILNAFYLVAKERVKDFVAAAKAVEEKFQHLKIKWIGPWPPFNFVTIKVGRG